MSLVFIVGVVSLPSHGFAGCDAIAASELGEEGAHPSGVARADGDPSTGVLMARAGWDHHQAGS